MTNKKIDVTRVGAAASSACYTKPLNFIEFMVILQSDKRFMDFVRRKNGINSMISLSFLFLFYSHCINIILFLKKRQLYKLMNQIANTFKSYNVKKGDRVAIYLPCCTVAVATMLANLACVSGR